MQIFIHFINGTVITVIIKLNINNFHVDELHEVIYRYEERADRRGQIEVFQHVQQEKILLADVGGD